MNRTGRLTARAVACLVLAAAAPAWRASAAEPLAFDGVWRNPKDTVHLELRPCGANVCGYVIWASDNARKKALRVGGAELVGTQLLRDFSRGDGHIGRGRVFVPDLGMTFGGTAERLDAHTIRAKGCVIGNLVCKSQIWSRIDAPAA